MSVTTTTTRPPPPPALHTQVGRPTRGGDSALPTPVGARVWVAQGAPHAAVYTPLHVLPAAEDDVAAGDGAFPPR